MNTDHEHNFLAGTVRRRAAIVIYAVAAAAIVVLAYYPSFSVPFQFDDMTNIRDNQHIRVTTVSLQKLWDAGVRSYASNRPVANISFALNHYVHGYEIIGYHLVNLAIHLITGLFIFLVFRDTLVMAKERNPGLLIGNSTSLFAVACAAALIWLVHPLATQSVTYLVQRMTSMAAMFSVMALYCYIRARLASVGSIRWLLYAAGMLCWILAMGSKEISATLPFFVFLYEWYFFRDMSSSRFKRQLIIIAVIIFLLALFFLGLNPIKGIMSAYTIRDYTLVQRVMTEWRVVLMYLGLIFFPYPGRLNLDYDVLLSYSLLDPPSTLLSLIIIAGLLVLSVWIARKDRIISFAILWYFGNLVIESSVIGLELVYEHRTYVPSMFVVLLAVLAVHRFLRPRWVQVLLLCAVVGVFSVWTYQRNLVWQSDLTLWGDVLKKSPDKARPHTNYGIALMDRDRVDEAIPHFERAVELAPNVPPVHRNLGRALYRQGRLDEAIEQYRKALVLKPGEVEFILELGSLLEKKGDLGGATELYRGAEDNVEAASALGRVLAQQGKHDEALGVFRRVLTDNTDRAEVHLGMGNIYVMQGRIDEARSAYGEALRIKPDYTAARSNLGDLAMKAGDIEGAIRHYEQALSTGVGSVSLLNRLAQAHAALGDYARATGYLEKVRGLQPDNAEAHYNIACVLARQGRRGEALQSLARAVDLGFADVELLGTDPDLEGIRGSEAFRELERKVRHRKEAP